MKTFMTALSALIVSASLTACVGVDEEDSLAETTSDLSASSWTTPVDVRSELSSPPAMAMLDGVEYYVYASDEGDPLPGRLWHDLYWYQCDGVTCTSPKRISGQLSMDRVNLAAFNGYIYMVHQGDTDDTAVWFSRLDPRAGVWSTNVKLPFTTFGGSPAIAAFNNQLYIVGSNEREVTRHGTTITTYPLWYATMDANELFSATRGISSESASPPSLAVLGNTLYLAHRNGATGEIVIQKMGAGGSWTAPQLIPAGPSNAYIQGDDVQLATVNGYLHLVHQRFSGNYTYWTYTRGCDWAPEITVDAFGSSSRSSLATGRNGTLVLNRLVDGGLWPYTVYHWYLNRFIAPAAPITVQICGAQG